MKIASLDFETANLSRVSMCAAGIALFEEGQLIESKSWLIKPPKGHGFFKPEWTDDIHGLNWFSVKDAPEFPTVAPEVISLLLSADLVIAHYAPFDMDVLAQTLQHYQLPRPSFRYLCTCRLARVVWPDLPNHKLNTLAAHIGHSFQHHEAESDAVAAGQVMLAMMKDAGVRCIETLCLKAGVESSLFIPHETPHGN